MKQGFIAAAALMVVLAIMWQMAPAGALAADAKDAKKDAKPDDKKKKPAPTKWRDAADPLHVAAFEGDAATMKKLLAVDKANVNVRLEFRTFNGYTPLHMAAYEGHAKIIDMLVAKKADLNLIEKSKKQTALHIASAYGRTEVVRSLIKGGADLNLKDKNGNTALKLASEKAIIAELTKAGATQ